MPRGVPKIGESYHVPQAESLGTISEQTLHPTPKAAMWQSESGAIDVLDARPPWETDSRRRSDNTDARRFVEAVSRASEIEFRWINPRLIDQLGWRDWQPVMARDKRWRVKVPQLVSPDGNIRRGGTGGDILAWMPKSWVESRAKQKAERVARLTQAAPDKMQQAKEHFERTHPGVTVTEAHHPTHTIAEGASMRD